MRFVGSITATIHSGARRDKRRSSTVCDRRRLGLRRRSSCRLPSRGLSACADRITERWEQTVCASNVICPIWLALADTAFAFSILRRSAFTRDPGERRWDKYASIGAQFCCDDVHWGQVVSASPRHRRKCRAQPLHRCRPRERIRHSRRACCLSRTRQSRPAERRRSCARRAIVAVAANVRRRAQVIDGKG